jgi:hypothetical protein
LVLYAAQKAARASGGAGPLAAGAGVEKLIGPLKRWLQDFF